MSETWINHHLTNNLNNQGVSSAVAQDILTSGYTSVLAQVSTDGTITYTLLDAAGQKIQGQAGVWTP